MVKLWWLAVTCRGDYEAWLFFTRHGKSKIAEWGYRAVESGAVVGKFMLREGERGCVLDVWQREPHAQGEPM